MATLSIEAILERVQELKHESDEKDEVIRVQQAQINELEARLEMVTALEEENRELRERLAALNETAAKADELLNRLNEILD